jgi:hypothetical protein
VSAQVTFTINAPGGDAEVSVDGEVKGKTPFTLRVDRGSTRHRIEVRRSGFATFRRSVMADRDSVIEAALVPRGGHGEKPEPAPGDPQEGEEVVEPDFKPMPVEPPAGGGSGSGSGSAAVEDLSGGRY